MANYSDLRIGNPVEINDEVTFVTQLCEQGGEKLIKVHGRDIFYRPNEVFFIHLDRAVYDTYEKEQNIVVDNNSEFTLIFSLTPLKVEYNFEKNECLVNGEIIEGVTHLHELFNLVEDVCGTKLPHYLPKTKAGAERRYFPDAPIEM